MENPSSCPRMLLSPGVRILLLFCLTVLFFLLMSFVAYIVLTRIGATTASMRILAIVQDISVFIVPALVTAMLTTRMPATLLAIDRRPDMMMSLLLLATFVVAIPAMNALIAWNEGIHFPESMKGIEDWLRDYETNASSSVKTILGGNTAGDLILGILITGIAAGFSEELYFRGALQRLLHCGGFNPHAAIWTAAIVFSAIHLQFFGFFPRLLLGAFFGYALLWSGSLWLAIGAHVLNNSIYVTVWYLSSGGEEAASASASPNWVIVAVSILLTAAGLLLMNRRYRLSIGK